MEALTLAVSCVLFHRVSHMAKLPTLLNKPPSLMRRKRAAGRDAKVLQRNNRYVKPYKPKQTPWDQRGPGGLSTSRRRVGTIRGNTSNSSARVMRLPFEELAIIVEAAAMAARTHLPTLRKASCKLRPWPTSSLGGAIRSGATRLFGGRGTLDPNV